MAGWGLLHREDIPGLGKRWASVCDTPEQDLLVQRYKPVEGAEFFAGMELSVLHLGLAAMALPVRWGWVRSLEPLSRPLLALAKCFLPFGSDRGAMTVSIRGKGAAGEAIARKWVLKAHANRGPNVPVIAALAMILRHRDGCAFEPGARVCSGILSLEDFAPHFASLGIEYGCIDEDRSAPVEQRAGTGAEPRIMAST